MSKILLYNTLTRRKEEFIPLNNKNVGMYYCGPTVYWTQHIGNLRGSFCADLVGRFFRYMDYRVNFVRNYTDVGHLTSDGDEGEDKMAKGAKREGLSPDDIARKYIGIYEQDTRELNISEPTVKARATEHIAEMIAMVQILLDRGFAYTTDLAVYFDVAKARDYTRLSGQVLEENIAGKGSGNTMDSAKRHPADFAIWFFRAGDHQNAVQYWPSPFSSPLVKDGEGFPGWHLECSAMSKKYLGDTFDIHMGGIEHVPVHHTNEIAQSESANGAKFVNYWLHNEHLLVNDRKMAKSEGTGYSLAEIKEKGFGPLDLRFFFLQAHYRSKLNFTWEALAGARNGLEHVRNQIRLLGGEAGETDSGFRDKFIEVLSDDINTPQALAVVQEMLKSDLPNGAKLATILDFDRVLGLDLDRIIDQEKMPEDIASLLQEREQARLDKNWPESDRLRSEIEARGYALEDTMAGQRVFRTERESIDIR